MFSSCILTAARDLMMMNPLNSAATDDGIGENEITSPDPQLLDLVPFVAGDRLFAVVADQVDGTAEAKTPAPLPHAPNAVLGVVCVRGRMLTVLDPVALLTHTPSTLPQTLPCVIALRGDEQIALAAESCRDTITIASADIEASVESRENTDGLALGLVRYGGEEITVLNAENLFTSAMLRRERRRRRF
ncbi:MAG TPA: chemotaxis protein CheW [Pyrinomonadaceae bacterium]|nr:chemotaxis protein CheW [Pyrinomonadaceae bacterium]